MCFFSFKNWVYFTFFLFYRNETNDTRWCSLAEPLQTAVALLDDGELDTLALGQGDEGLVCLADDEDVSEAGGEGVTQSILDVDNVEASLMTLTVDNGADTSHVVSAGHEAEVAGVELNVVSDLSGLDLEEHDIVGLDGGVGVADGATVVGDNVGNALSTGAELLDPAELELKWGREGEEREIMSNN